MATMSIQVFSFLALLIIQETFEARQPASPVKQRKSHVCKFKENIKLAKCKITISEQDGKVKSRAKCKSKKKKPFRVENHSILPTNQECQGLVFYVSLKSNGRTAKLTSVNWKQNEDETPQCLSEFEPVKITRTMKRQNRDSQSQASFWMKRVDKETKLHDLSIPGTHDSMAYQGTWATTWHLCQSASLRTQLDQGVRFFDIRLGVREPSTTAGEIAGSVVNLGLYHGDGLKKAFLDNHFHNVMWEFNSFLDQHPSEAIIFRYRDETGEAGEFCKIFDKRVKQYASKIWVSKNGYNGGYQSGDGGSYYTGNELKDKFPPLEEIRKKIVIIRVNKHCFGYRFNKKSLDNWNGEGTNPLTGSGYAKLITCGGRRRRRSLESEDSKLYTSIQKDNNDSSASKPKNTDENQVQMIAQADIEDGEEGFTNETLSNENKIRKIISTKGFCNLTDSEKTRASWYCYIPPISIWCSHVEPVVEVVEALTCNPSTEYKQELKDGVDSVHNGFRNHLNLIYASATKIPTVSPKGFADPVNKYLHSLLSNSYFWASGGLRTGVILFDYIINWNNDLPSKVFRHNWNACAKLYDDRDMKGEVVSAVDEIPDLDTVGFDDRVSSVWVAAGCKVYVYEHPKFTGKWIRNTNIKTYNTYININSLNDRTSSMKCECYEGYLPEI